MSEMIQTLDTNEGRNPGEAIASYGRSIIFLPPGTPVGKRVRVKLEEITTKKDSCGRTMYKGIPADVEYTERWKDNGDGTATHITIATNWLLEESEEGVVETRRLEQSESSSTSTEQSFSIVWGTDFSTSRVEEKIITVTPALEERVIFGELKKVRVGEKREPSKLSTHPIVKLEFGNCDFKYRVLETGYDSKWSVMLTVSYRADWGVLSQNFNTMLAEMPEWWRKQIEARYPICVCSRQRRDTQVEDGYGKCELCRAEQACERCGKQAGKNGFKIGSRLVCEDCNPWEVQEQLVAQLLNADHKAAIAAEARRLRQGRTFPREEGLAILKATIEHISPNEMDYNRRKILQGWSAADSKDRQWYYFCEEATYGSFYSPAALQLLEFLPQASGNALVEFIGWIAYPSFYLSTQVEGRDVQPIVTEDQLGEVVRKLDEGESILADRLRGSEADRIAALSGYRRLVEILGEDSDEARAVAEILQDEKQDYAAAVKKIRKVEGKRVPVQQGVAEVVQAGRLNLAALRENWGAKVKLR